MTTGIVKPCMDEERSVNGLVACPSVKDIPIRVSVIIPCYNRERFLPETLNSLSRQTFQAWEAVIVDDNSTDRSLEVARSFQQLDGRFRVFARESERRGGNVCRNEGIRRARADYLVFLDSDDLLECSALEQRVGAMDGAPSSGFGVYQTEIFHERMGDSGAIYNTFFAANDLHRFLSFDAVWHTTGPIWRKSTIEALGGFDESLPSMQDWDLHVRALISNVRYFKVSTRDNYYRMVSSTGNAIASRFTVDPVHLRSHESLLERTLERLRKADLLDGEATRRMVGLYWWLATRYRVTQGWSECRRVWLRALELGLLNRRHYWEGLFVSRLAAAFPGGRWLGRPIQNFWPKEYHSLYSRHLHNSPAAVADGSVIWGGGVDAVVESQASGSAEAKV